MPGILVQNGNALRLALLLTLVMRVSAAHVSAQTQEANQDGEALYKERCATCHDKGVPRAASREALGRLSPDVIRQALTSGTMRTQAEGLTAAQVEALTRLLAGATPSPSVSSDNRCQAGTPFADPFNRPRWNGWGANLAQHRFQPAAMAQLSAADVPRLELKWAFGFPGVNRAFAQPTVVGGRLFVGSASGVVYSLSADTGCQHWAFKADAPVRTAISIGPADAAASTRWTAYFGDQAAHVYAVDALSGELLWKRRVDEYPGATMTAAPTLAGGSLYVGTSSAEEVLGANAKYECCRFRGGVAALDAATGEVRWKSFTIPEEPKPVRKNKQGVQLWGPSGAGVWSSPTVDLERGIVYVTTGDSYSDPAAGTSDAFVAFDLRSGELLWSRQTTSGDAFTIDCSLPEALRTNCPEANGPDVDFGSSAMLVELPNQRRALIAGQKSGVVHAIDPDRSGEILWQTSIGKGGALGGIQWGTAFDGSRVYAALSDVQPEPAPPGTPGAQPSFIGAMRLNPKAGGGLFALSPEDGTIVWHTPHPGCGERPGCSPAQSAAVTAIPGVIFSGGLDGHLRAYASDTGRVIWDMDTAQPYTTVNAVAANGGSLDGPGPIVVGGMLFVNSGYAFVGGMPGNVLLAYSVDGH
jgi:polyvinyl alcohol dehydrogenase (cytochrome)